jgi:hypothetical protein
MCAQLANTPALLGRQQVCHADNAMLARFQRTKVLQSACFAPLGCLGGLLLHRDVQHAVREHILPALDQRAPQPARDAPLERLHSPMALHLAQVVLLENSSSTGATISLMIL